MTLAPVLRKPASVRGLRRRAMLVPLAVFAPLTTLALTADHRYNVYWHGAVVRDDPAALVTDNLRTVGMYLDFGNFRPLGRMLEWSVDLAAYLLVELLQLPAEVALRLLTAGAAAALTAAAMVFAEALTARADAPPSRAVVLLPFALGGGLVAAGSLSTTVLFGGLYFLSAALVLLTGAWLCRAPRSMPLLLLAGASLAAFNEVGCLAVPFATAALLARGWFVLGRLTLRPAVLLGLGFLPVFGPVRLLIRAACADGDCYRGSDLAAGPDVLPAFANRLTAWLPPLQWSDALRGAARPGPLAVTVALVIFGLLAWRAIADLPRLAALDRRQAAALITTGAALVLLGSVLGALNAQVQAADRWGMGWRDSGLTAAGGALLVTGLLAVRAGRPAVVLLALVAAGSTLANQAYAVHQNRAPAALLNNAIDGEVAQFDPTPAGDARRCALRARYAELFPASLGYSRFAEAELPGTHSPLDRFDTALNLATEQLYGQPFCRAIR